MENLNIFGALLVIASKLTVGDPPMLAQTPPTVAPENQIPIQTKRGTITVEARLCGTPTGVTSAVVTPILPPGFSDVPEVQKQQTILNLTSGVYIVQSNQSDAARQVLTTLIPAWASVPRNDIPVTCPENTSTIPFNTKDAEKWKKWQELMLKVPAK
jgi:hypothetical protein